MLSGTAPSGESEEVRVRVGMHHEPKQQQKVHVSIANNGINELVAYMYSARLFSHHHLTLHQAKTCHPQQLLHLCH